MVSARRVSAGWKGHTSRILESWAARGLSLSAASAFHANDMVTRTVAEVKQRFHTGFLGERPSQ